MSAAFLLNRRYQPYYKWRFRAFRALETLSELSQSMEQILTTGNDAANASMKTDLIEQICAAVRSEVLSQNLSDVQGDDLERHAYAVNNTIENAELRNLHILAAV